MYDWVLQPASLGRGPSPFRDNTVLIQHIRSRRRFRSVELFDGHGTPDCLTIGPVDHLEEVDRDSSVSVEVGLSARLATRWTDAAGFQQNARALSIGSDRISFPIRPESGITPSAPRMWHAFRKSDFWDSVFVLCQSQAMSLHIRGAGGMVLFAINLRSVSNKLLIHSVLSN
jgi:hypothetical protein